MKLMEDPTKSFVALGVRETNSSIDREIKRS